MAIPDQENPEIRVRTKAQPVETKVASPAIPVEKAAMTVEKVPTAGKAAEQFA